MGSKLSKISLIFLFIIIFTVFAGAQVKFLIVAPGMQFTPGATGFSGSPSPQTAGIPFNVTVVTVDTAVQNMATDSAGGNVSMTAGSLTTVISPVNPFTLGQGYTGTSYTANTCLKYPVTVTFGTGVSGNVGLYANNQPNPNGIVFGSVTVTSQVLSKFVIGNAAGAKTAGVPFAVSLTALDASNNIVTSFNGTANLTANYPVIGSVSLGTVTFTAGVCNTALSPNVTLYDASEANVTLGVSVTYPGYFTASGTSPGFVVNAAALSQLVIVGPGQTFTPGVNGGNGRVGQSETTTAQTAGLPFQIKVYAVDAYFNTVTTSTSVTVTCAADNQAGFNAATVQPFTNGQVTVNCNLKTVGPTGFLKISASNGSSAVDDDIVPLNPAAMNHFTFLNPGNQVSAKAGVSFQLNVCARDAYENTVTSYTGTPVLSVIVGGNPLTTPDYFTNYDLVFDNTTNGVSTTYMIIYKRLLTATINVTDGSYNAGPQLNVSISPNNYNKLIIVALGESQDQGNNTDHGKSGTPVTATVGGDESINIYATDLYGNVVNSITDNIQITSSDVSATAGGNPLPVILPLVSGTISIPDFIFRTFISGGTRSITVTDQSNTAITASENIVVRAGSLSYFEIGNMPTGSFTAGASYNPIIRARDQFGNVKTDYSGIVYVTSNTDWTQPYATTISITASTNAGQYLNTWAVTFTASNLGVRSDLTGYFFRASTFTAQLFVSDNPNDTPAFINGHYGFSSNVTVTAGSPNQLQVLVPGMSARPGAMSIGGQYGSPTGQAVNAAFNCSVNVVDQYWNVITTNSGTQIILTTNNVSNSKINGATPPRQVFTSAGTVLFTALNGTQSSSFFISASTSGGINPGNSPIIQIFNIGQFLITAPNGVTFDDASMVNQTAGHPFTISITALDGFGAVIPGFNGGTVPLKASNNYSDSNFCISPTQSITFTAGVAVMNVTLYRASHTMPGGGGKITVDVPFGNNTYSSAQFNLWPAAPSGSIVIFDGMSLEPGLFAAGIPGYLGYIGTPKIVEAGQGSSLTIYIVDPYYNRCFTLPNTQCVITSSDLQATLNGVVLYSNNVSVPITTGYYNTPSGMILKTVGDNAFQTITADSQSSTTPSVPNNTSPPINMKHTTNDHFGVLVPGAPETAGVSFNITVQALDAWGNICDNRNGGTAFNNSVNLSCSTGPNTITPTTGPLSNGSALIGMKIFKAEELHAKITAQSGGLNVSGTSVDIHTLPKEFSRLLVLAPGMVFQNGVYNSSTITPFLMYNPSNYPFDPTFSVPVNDPGNIPSGTQFTIFSCDEYGNVTKTPDLAGYTVTVSTDDPYAIPVTRTTIDPVNGFVSANVIFHKAMPGVFVKAVISNPQVSSFTTLTFTTTAGNAYGLQILAPGYSLFNSDGSTSTGSGYLSGGTWYNGVTKRSTTIQAGQPFPVTVQACDIFGNTLSGLNDSLSLYSDASDPSVPSDATFYNTALDPVSGIVSFTAKLYVDTGNYGLYAINVTDITNSSYSSNLWKQHVTIPVTVGTSIAYKILARATPLSDWVERVDGTESVPVYADPSTFGIQVVVYDTVSGQPLYGNSNQFNLEAVSYTNPNQQAPGTLRIINGNVVNGTFQTDNQSFTNAGTIRIKVTDLLDPTKTNTSPKLVVNANPNSVSFSVRAENPNVRANKQTNIIGNLIDGNGNSVSGVSIAFSVCTGSGTFGANTKNATAVTDILGNATVPFFGGFTNDSNIISALYNGTYRYVTVNVSLADPSPGQVSNYPNPFRAGFESTNITYLLETSADVKIRIYNLFGDLVFSKDISAGQPGAQAGPLNIFAWDGKNNKGAIVGNGGYVCTVESIFQGAKKKLVRKIAVAK
jgi:hypothetical protein